MKNFVHGGSTANIIATAAIKSGDFVASGGIFGLAQKDADIDQSVAIVTDGVYDTLVTSTSEIEQGTIVYFDGVELTTESNDGEEVDPVAYTRAGLAWSAGALDDESGRYKTFVKINA